MSIYGTVFSAGGGDEDDAPGRVSAYTGNRATDVATGVGNDRTHVGLATIPGWCWPNGNDGADAIPDAPWLRLSVSAAMPGRTDDWPYAAVNLDVDAARSLRDALSEWIDGEHLPELDRG